MFGPSRSAPTMALISLLKVYLNNGKIEAKSSKSPKDTYLEARIPCQERGEIHQPSQV